MTKKDLYQILEIPEFATEEKIKKAYHTLSKKYHPDAWANASKEEAERAKEKFQEIGWAYDILSSEKEKYDKLRATRKKNQERQPKITTAKKEEQPTSKNITTSSTFTQTSYSKSTQKASKEQTKQQEKTDPKKKLLLQLERVEAQIDFIDEKIKPLKNFIRSVGVKYEEKERDLDFRENCEINELVRDRESKISKMNFFAKKFQKRKSDEIYEDCNEQINDVRKKFNSEREELEKEWEEEKELARPRSEIYQRRIEQYLLYRQTLEQQRNQINMQLYGMLKVGFENTSKKAI